MEKIIKSEPEKMAKKSMYPTFKKKFLYFWDKSKMFIGYTVALALAVVFLTAWPIDWLFLSFSLIWAIFYYLRLPIANVGIQSMPVVFMWAILSFGLSGIIMQSLRVFHFISIGVFAAGIVYILLYVFIPTLSYYLRYSNKEYGWDDSHGETRYNGFLASTFILDITLVIWILYDL